MKFCLLQVDLEKGSSTKVVVNCIKTDLGISSGCAKLEEVWDIIVSFGPNPFFIAMATQLLISPDDHDTVGSKVLSPQYEAFLSTSAHKSSLCRSVHPQVRRFLFLHLHQQKKGDLTLCTAAVQGLEKLPRLLCCSSHVLFPETPPGTSCPSLILLKEIRGIVLKQMKATFAD